MNKKEIDTKRYLKSRQLETLVIAGTYERLLYGLTLNEELLPCFIYPAHHSCIKAIGTNEKFLATGSTDEHVKLYDLQKRKEVGSLLHHNGTITGLLFVKKHLLTCAEDGMIGIVRIHDWQHIKNLMGHKKGVLSMDCHSSGKVLLSVSADKTLKCWDLTRGLLSYSLSLNRVPIQVKWCLDDIHFCISFDNLVEIHSIVTGACTQSISFKSRINSIATSIIKGQQVVITGGEDKMVRIYCLDGSVLASFESKHSLRIKSMDILDSLLVTCGSDGTIFVWDLEMLDNIKPIQEYNAKCRLTCVGICKARKYEKEEEIEHEYPESDYEDVIVKKQKITISYEKSDQKKQSV